jgi:hypothetical protein
MPTANGFGIAAATGATLESVEINYQSEIKSVMTSDGDFSEARISDVTQSFTIRGTGTSGVSIGGSGGGPSSLSGQVVITSVKRTQTNEDFEKFEYSGTCYPNA